MLNDPLVITIDSVPYNLARTQPGELSSVYQNSDLTISEVISHQSTKGGRFRRLVGITFRKVVTDPLTSENDYDDLRINVVIDEPGYGFDDSEVQDIWAGHAALVTAQLANILASQH